MTDIHPAEPGAYWGKTEEYGDYNVILFITGKVPFFRIANAISFPDGKELNGAFHVGPKMEQLCVDAVMVEGGAA